MIQVTRLNDKKFHINCDLIETLESTPDTVITLTNGKKLVVKEGTDDIVEKIISFKKRIHRYEGEV